MTSVALLADQVLSPLPGGIGVYVRRLVPALSAADPELAITLFHSRIRGARPEPWMRELRVEELPAGIRTLYPSWALLGRPALPPSLSAPDILHVPNAVAVPPKGPGQRLVVTVHDLAFVVRPDVFPARWRLQYRAGLRRAVRTADAVIAVSRRTGEDLVRRTRIDPSKVHVVPLGPSLPLGSGDPDEALRRLKVPVPYILFNGTLEPRKNLVRLVRAYRRVARAGSPHALVLAGPMGWRAEPLLRQIEAGGPGTVVLTGRVPAADLDALYRAADLFAYPSLYEGFGLPVLDAMARGIPCVVSTAGSLPEVAGEAAVPVDPHSEAGLADTIGRVLLDPSLRARLRQAGLARAGAFSWEDAARRTLEIYRGGSG